MPRIRSTTKGGPVESRSDGASAHFRCSVAVCLFLFLAGPSANAIVVLKVGETGAVKPFPHLNGRQIGQSSTGLWFLAFQGESKQGSAVLMAVSKTLDPKFSEISIPPLHWFLATAAACLPQAAGRFALPASSSTAPIRCTCSGRPASLSGFGTAAATWLPTMWHNRSSAVGIGRDFVTTQNLCGWVPPTGMAPWAIWLWVRQVIFGSPTARRSEWSLATGIPSTSRAKTAPSSWEVRRATNCGWPDPAHKDSSAAGITLPGPYRRPVMDLDPRGKPASGLRKSAGSPLLPALSRLCFPVRAKGRPYRYSPLPPLGGNRLLNL